MRRPRIRTSMPRLEVPLLLCLFFVILVAPWPAAQISIPATGQPLPGTLDDLGWIKTGGPLGGTGYDIRMHPLNPDIMYVTDAKTGIHISYDGGETWAPSNDGIDVRSGPSGDLIPAFCVTIDPNSPNIVWAGLADYGAIYRSQDGGLTWEKRVNGLRESAGLTVRGLTVQQGNSDVLYAAGEVSSWVWSGQPLTGRNFDRTQGVVYKSTDGGDLWFEVWRGDNLVRYIWIDPRNSDVVYVSTGIFDRECVNTDLQAGTLGGVGILKSTDGGASWTVLNEQNGLDGLIVGSLYMHPENPDILIAGTGADYWSRPSCIRPGDQLMPSGVFITENGGLLWTKTLDQHITSVEISETDPSIVYAAGEDAFFRSEDGGWTWTQVGGSLLSGFWGPVGIQPGHPIDLQCDPRDPDRVFSNNYAGGNYLSEDGGRTWSYACTGYTGCHVHQLAVSQQDPLRVYASAFNGVFRTDNGGGNWVGIVTPRSLLGSAVALAVDPADDSRVVASPNAPSSQLLRTSSSGESWLKSEIQGPSADRVVVNAVAFAPSNPRVIYAGYADRECYDRDMGSCSSGSLGFMRSTDGGRSWRRVGIRHLGTAHICAITVHPEDPDIVYVGTLGKGVFESTNGGSSWSYVGLQGKSVYGIAFVDREDGPVLFAGTSGGVHECNLLTREWTNRTSGLDPEIVVRAIVASPADASKLWIGNESSGVYYTETGGQEWWKLNDGLSVRSVTSLAISADGLYLYAGTNGGGVFRRNTHAGSLGTSRPDEAQPSDEDDEGRLAESDVPDVACCEAFTELSGWKLAQVEDFDDGMSDASVRMAEQAGGESSLSADGGDTVFAATCNCWLTPFEQSWHDCALSVRMSVVSGEATVSFRQSDVGRYYVELTSDGGGDGSLCVGKEVWGGDRDRLSCVPLLASLSSWMEITIVGVGSTLRVFLDGELQITHTDLEEPLLRGTIGLETMGANPRMDIDWIVVRQPP